MPSSKLLESDCDEQYTDRGQAFEDNVVRCKVGMELVQWRTGHKHGAGDVSG